MDRQRESASLWLTRRPARPPPRLPAAGETRTFYAYHVFMDGAQDTATISVGPANQAKLHQNARKL